MNWDAIEAYSRAVNASSRLGAEPKVDGPAPEVDLQQTRWYRAAAMHLDDRLKPGSHAQAAFAGLQDSAPRAALYGLHARMENACPSAWEDPALVQIWFRGGADYVFPRVDIGVFTLGALPRDPGQVAALNDAADVVLRALDGTPKRTRDVEDVLPDRFLIRGLCVTGKIHIRWDARTTTVIPSEPAGIDLEHARLELARRFLHWHGPAGAAHFAKWARIPKPDANETFAALGRELVPVDLDGRARWILAADEAALTNAKPSRGVRLLPGGADPFLYMDAEPVPRTPDVGPDVTQRLVNSLGGRILVDGELVGAWGRVQANVTLFGWTALSDDVVERVETEANGFSGPLGKPVRLRWL